MFKRPLLPGLIWTLLIAVLTLVPGNYIPRITSFLDWLSPDKILHFILFGTYAYLLAKGFHKQGISSLLKQNPMIFSIIIGIVFAFFIEVMQMFVIPGRDGNVYDFTADVLGTFLGIGTWYIAGRNEKKNLHSSKKYN
ncbi:MAG: VanZ family protein [Bacteroidales bacterium]|jgi:VanZ family protein|nr:VanZ family protein [Bacteroidales bacterium]